MTFQDRLIKKSLKYSVLDGSFHAAMLGFGESFFAVFAVFLKASNIHLGLLSSLPLMLASVTQMFSNRLINLFKSRKKLVSSAALFQAFIYIPVMLVFFAGEIKVPLLIFIISLYSISGMILGPAWNSWMGDLVPEKKRGIYFGRRNKITGFSTLAATLAAGYILYLFSNGETGQYLGFVVIFMLALTSRIVSSIFISKKFEPEYKTDPGAEFSFIEFIREARFRNYGLFVLYLSLMNFSVYLSAPFFTPYMLRDLNFDYVTFTVVNSAAIIVKLLAMPVWGRASDQYGTKKILSLTGFLMPLAPLLWAFSHDMLYLLFIQAYSGFIWAGFEIASFNFVFDSTTPQKRATAIAYFNIINGVCIFIGSLTGGFIVKYNQVFWSKYVLVFVTSCFLRYVISFIFIPKLKEVRPVEKIPYPKLFFKIVSTMPTIGLVFSLIPFRREIKK